MKHPLLTIIVLVVIALLAICVRICAKTGKMPKGKLVSYQYNRGGGMNPLDYTIFHLRYDETTKKPLLTISGDCQGEEITVEVGGLRPLPATDRGTQTITLERVL